MQNEGKGPESPGADPLKGMAGNPATPPPAADAQHPAADNGAPELGALQLKEIVVALQEENDKLRAERDAARDHHLRAVAEMDNIRKRYDREKADVAKYAVTKFAGDVANVADNFERAIKSVPEGADVENPTLKALLEGVTMTEREFFNVLERHGVKRVDPKGELFNPHLHQAVMETQNPEVPAGTVMQVFQAGYTIEDRILRPAMVSVAKGGFKPAKAPEATPQPANDDKPAGPDAAAGGNGQAG